MLIASGKPYTIENVAGALKEMWYDTVVPLGTSFIHEQMITSPREMHVNTLRLCGTMFNLQVFRHRLFENNMGLVVDRVCQHSGKSLGTHSSHCSRKSKKTPVQTPTPTLTTPAPVKTVAIDWNEFEREERHRTSGRKDIVIIHKASRKRFRSIVEAERWYVPATRDEECESEERADEEQEEREEVSEEQKGATEMFAVYGDTGNRGSLEEWQRAMNTPWILKSKPIAQAIPPAFSEYLARQVLKKLGYNVSPETLNYASVNARTHE